MAFNVSTFRNEPFTDFSDPLNKKAFEEALKKVESELGRKYPLIIKGKEVYTNETFKSINPSKYDEIIGEFSVAKREHIEEAINVSWETFEEWKKINAKERAAILLRAAYLLRKRKHEFSATMVLEVGKNWAEADADTAEAIDYLEFYAREAVRFGELQSLTPFEGEIPEYFYIPLGVGVIIPPWNFPLAITLGMTTASIVTGNCAILKPSSDAPLIAYKFVKLMHEAGLPEGVLNLLTGSGSKVGDPLVSHPKTRFVAFTGSREVGCHIYELAAKVSQGQKWLKRVIAEMGGKNAIIIDKEANFEDAVKWVIVSAYGYQGQKCSACSRLIVHKDIYDKFIEMLLEEVKKIKIGPARENYFMGPVINASSENKILSYIETGKKEGKLIFGGKKAQIEGGYFIEPTVFIDIDENATIAQEEIFGPVLSVIKAKDFDDAIRIANNSDYGLTGAVFSFNRKNIIKAKEDFHVGNLYINRKCTGALVDVHPFGGFNMSGTDSKAGGRDYLLLFLQGKSVSERISF
ncbi:MAG: L-glutamate gamma-semialdehyde dehydrogenase [Candidatus Hydrothermales bacterium]